MGWLSSIPGLGAMVGATMEYWYPKKKEEAEENASDPKGVEKVEPAPIEPPKLRFPSDPSEPEKPEVPLPVIGGKKKKKKPKPKVPAVAGVQTPASMTATPPLTAEHVPVAKTEVPPVKSHPPFVILKEAPLGTKLEKMIKPPDTQSGSKIRFFVDKLFTPGEMPLPLGKHKVTYKVESADGTVGEEEFCANLEIVFPTDKVFKKMGFGTMRIGYILNGTQAHAGKSYAVHVTVPYEGMLVPASLNNWTTKFDEIYKNIIHAGSGGTLSGTHVTYEVENRVSNNSGWFLQHGGDPKWKTARGATDDALQQKVCEKAYKVMVPTLKPALKKAIGEVVEDFEKAVKAAVAPYTGPGASNG